MNALTNTTRNQTIVPQVLVAKTLSQRFIGLLSRSELPKEQTLWIHDCPSIHTFFMRFTIDAVFVDKNLKVTKIVRKMKPFRMTFHDFKAESVFEFSSAHNLTKEIQLGDQLHVGG